MSWRESDRSSKPLVVSILAPDLDALGRAARAQEPHADVLELRLDSLKPRDVDGLATVVRSLARPVIAAVHGREGFGTFAGSVSERLEILRAAARAGAAFVDVDARYARELGALPASTRRIVSHHEKESTPDDLTALFARIEALAEREDLVKIVTHAERAEDGLRMLDALRASTRERVAFCSGERGAFTRVLAPIFGSRFTFAAPAGTGEGTAPGQWRADRLRAALPAGGTTRSTRFFAVVGSPIAHSWSPRLHTAVFRAMDLDAVYVACEPDEFAPFFRQARALGFAGLSITAPFKSDAAACADEQDESVQAIGAANTLVRVGDRWHATNTDASAVEAAITAGLAPRTARGETALVVGAGGAARAAVQALVHLGADVHVTARDPARARTLAAAFGVSAVEGARVSGRRFALLVHCTPMGTAAQGSSATPRTSIPVEWLHADQLVLDAVYRPRETELLAAARERGARTISGADWFLRQAAAQSRLFTGRDAVEDVLRVELERAYAEEEAR